MTAREHLNPQQFGPMYHGTDFEFKPGDVVSPRNYPTAYATNNPIWASIFANDRSRFGGPNNGPTGNRPRLYRVEPMDESDVESGLMGTGIVVHKSAKGFRVVGEEDLRD